MAERTLIVRVIGDDRSLQAAMLRDQKAVTTFGNTATTSLGKVDAAFSRTQRLAAGGFIGGAAIAAGVVALKSVVNAAADSQAILKQTQVALESTGKSWEVYGNQIEDTVKKQSQLGFDDEDLLKTFALFVRNTNDVTKALDENSLAMDVARARGIDLASAAQIVNKAAIGQAGALRRLGIDAKQGASGVELLTLLNEKYGGSAEAAGNDAKTAFDRVAVSTQNLKESLGGLISGPVADLTNSLADAAEEASLLVDKLHALGDVKIPPIKIPFVADFGGGGSTIGTFFKDAAVKGGENIPIIAPFVRALEIAVAARADKETKNVTPTLADKFEVSLNTMFTSALNTAAQNVKPDAGKIKGFGTGLTPADLFGPLITDIPKALQESLLNIEIATPDNHKAIIDALTKQRNSLLDALDDPRLKTDQRIQLKEKIKTLNSAIDSENAAIQASVDDANQKRTDAASKAAQSAQDAKDKLAATFARLIQALQLDVDKAGLTKTLNDDLSSLVALKKGLEKQIKAGVDVATAQTALVATVGQIADKQEEIRQKALEAAQARQFRALGLDAAGGQLVPGVDNLQKQLRQLTQRLAASGEDLPAKLTQQLEGARKVLSGKLDEVKKDSRDKINQLFKTIRDTFDQNSKQGGPLTRNSVFQANKILEGLGLSPEIEQQIRRRVASFNNADKAPPRFNAPTSTAAAGGAVVVQNINTITLDGDVVARNMTRSQQKTARRSPRQKRGPNRNP